MQTDVQGALMQRDLHDVVIDVRERKTGFRVDAHETGAKVQLGAGVFIGPNIVGDGQRTILFGLHPIVSAMRLNGDLSRHVVDAGYAARRIGCIGSLVLYAGGTWRRANWRGRLVLRASWRLYINLRASERSQH
jgi:hypothetical protein